MVISSFHISTRYARVGIILFSTRPYLVIPLGRNRNKKTLFKAIDRIRYPRKGTNTHLALRLAKRAFFRGRTSRKRVLLVLTDGKAARPVSAAASALKKAGVRIFAIGIGRKYNTKQLFQMASGRRYVYTASFRNLRSVVRSIKKKACKRKSYPITLSM